MFVLDYFASNLIECFWCIVYIPVDQVDVAKCKYCHR